MPRLCASVRDSEPPAGAALAVDAKQLVALDLETGSPRWKLPTTGWVSFAESRQGLIVGDDSSVRGVEITTGKVRWKQPANGKTWVAPMSDEQALAHMPHSIATIEYATGAVHNRIDQEIGLSNTEVLSAKGGKVVMALKSVGTLFSLKNGKLVRSDVNEHLGVEGLLHPGMRIDAVPVAATLDGDRLVMLSKNNTVEFFKIE